MLKDLIPAWPLGRFHHQIVKPSKRIARMRPNPLLAPAGIDSRRVASIGIRFSQSCGYSKRRCIPFVKPCDVDFVQARLLPHPAPEVHRNES